MFENYDIDLIRNRLAALGVASEIGQPYLALLTNLNALALLLDTDSEDEAEGGEMELKKILQEHQERKARWEEKFPILIVAVRPIGWKTDILQF